MNHCFVLGLSVVLLAGSAFADSEYQPPEVGTQITWQVPVDKDGRDKRVSQVVAQGDDFVIYLYDQYDDTEEPLSYYAEFSGIHVTSCAYEMPTAEERETLRQFWPLETGKSLQIGSAETVLTTYEVGQRTLHMVSQIDGERPAQHVTSIDGNVRTDVVVSLDWGTPVLMGWNNGQNARAIEMFSPIVPAVPVDGLVLGECAQLLDE